MTVKNKTKEFENYNSDDLHLTAKVKVGVIFYDNIKRERLHLYIREDGENITSVKIPPKVDKDGEASIANFVSTMEDFMDEHKIKFGSKHLYAWLVGLDFIPKDTLTFLEVYNIKPQK